MPDVRPTSTLPDDRVLFVFASGESFELYMTAGTAIENAALNASEMLVRSQLRRQESQ
jgi:hypothetical protein